MEEEPLKMQEYWFTAKIRLMVPSVNEEDAVARYKELLLTIPPSIKVSEETEIVIKPIEEEE